MPRRQEFDGAESLREALSSQLDAVTLAKLQQVCEHSGLAIQAVVSRAISAGCDELVRKLARVAGSHGDEAPVNAERPGPAILPAEGTDARLALVELGDIVRLKRPYRPTIGMDRQRGDFGFGIVAEIIHVLPDGRTRNVSLYLYDPQRREIFLGPNGIPEFVDFHCCELVLYKRANEQGYRPLVPREQWARVGNRVTGSAE